MRCVGGRLALRWEGLDFRFLISAQPKCVLLVYILPHHTLRLEEKNKIYLEEKNKIYSISLFNEINQF